MVGESFHLQERATSLQSRALERSQTERIMLLLRSQWEVSLEHAFIKLSDMPSLISLKQL